MEGFIWKVIISSALASVAIGKGIQIKQERSDKNVRFTTMAELEEKSAYYLRHYQHIRNDKELKEKVEIMSARFDELYREEGLDVIIKMFEAVDDLKYTLGSEEIWREYVGNLSNPKPPEEPEYSNQTLMIVACALFLPLFGIAYTTYKNQGGEEKLEQDSEWTGGELKDHLGPKKLSAKHKRLLRRMNLPKLNLRRELANFRYRNASGSSENVLEPVPSEETVKSLSEADCCRKLIPFRIYGNGKRVKLRKRVWRISRT